MNAVPPALGGTAPALRLFRYRGVRVNGGAVAGEIETGSEQDAIAQLRRLGITPIALDAAREGVVARRPKAPRHNAAISRALIGELSVLLGAGLPLDRALTLAIANIEDEAAADAMGGLLQAVREGAPLSRAMRAHPALFSPAEAAMAEAGEASGQLGLAMARLSVMLEQAAELRRLVITSLIYPTALLIIAVGVILMMLLFVVPQFERLLDNSRAQLPAASMAVIGVSRFVRAYGLWLLLGLIAAGIVLAQALARPAARAWLDRAVLRVPQLGELVRRIDTARMAHTLSALLDGGVPLPDALMLAHRTVANTVIAAAVRKVADGLREGGSLAGPLAAAAVLPRIAIGFLHTGEETSRLGLMLGRLAAVLDRDVRVRLERMVAILTPAITVLLGAVVATIIAAIMSAILGFNDLAVGQ